MEISKISSIPGIQVIPLAAEDPAQKSKRFKIIVNEREYDYSQEELFYKQQTKNISFRERFNLGCVIGYGKVSSFFMALGTIFDSQDKITNYYLNKFKNVTPLQFLPRAIEFYRRRNVSFKEQNEKIYKAYYNQVVDGNQLGNTSLDEFAKNIFYDIKKMDYNTSTHQLKIFKDRNPLQTIGRTNIRRNPFTLFGFSGLINKEAIISEELLNLTEDPLFEEAQNIQSNILRILGFQKI